MNNNIARAEFGEAVRNTGEVVVTNHTFMNVGFAYAGPAHQSNHVIALYVCT